MTLPIRGLCLFASLSLVACGGLGGTPGTDAGAGDSGVSGVACSLNTPQPDVCGYGNACYDTLTCAGAYDDTCGNITQAISRGTYTAWAAASTGPVIYNLVDNADVQADCLNPATDSAFTLTIYAYAGAGYTFPANKSGLSGFWYFTTAGEKFDIAINYLRTNSYTTSNGGKNMQATFTLCSATSNLTQIQAAFAFTNGNAYCVTLTR